MITTFSMTKNVLKMLRYEKDIQRTVINCKLGIEIILIHEIKKNRIK